MAASKRKIGIYTTSGVAIAVIIIAAIFASGIQLPINQNQTGTLSVSIKDAPVDLKKLLLTVDALYISNANDDTTTWTELALKDQPMTFDLLQLTGDNSLKLSEQIVLAGDYSKIRLDVTKAVATYTDSKGVEHTDEILKVPSSHIDIITSFSVDNSEVTGLIIDMQPDTAAISQSGNFRPIVKMTVTPQVAPSPTPTITPTPT